MDTFNSDTCAPTGEVNNSIPQHCSHTSSNVFHGMRERYVRPFWHPDYNQAEISLTHCMLGSFFMLFAVCWVFQNQLLPQNIRGIPHSCHTVWIQIKLNVLSGLIKIETVCKRVIRRRHKQIKS